MLSLLHDLQGKHKDIIIYKAPGQLYMYMFFMGSKNYDLIVKFSLVPPIKICVKN